MPSEFDLIRRHFVRPTPNTRLGPGDDCALIAPTAGCELAVTSDMLVEGTHFLPDTDPFLLGWKTLAVNLSDLAAMGARARWVTLAGSLPDADEAWIAAFASGFRALADAHQVDLIGGDTTRGPRNFCVTAIGELPRNQALRRDGAQAGDDLWVSGQPGRAALGLQHLLGKVQLPEGVREPCLNALHRPQPRLDLGMRLRGVAHACIDISDGLLADLQHILDRSGLSARIRADHLPARPVDVAPDLALDCLLAGGDDYELLFTAAPQHRHRLEIFANELALPLTRIGELFAGPAGELHLLAADGQRLTPHRKGYDHFA